MADKPNIPERFKFFTNEKAVLPEGHTRYFEYLNSAEMVRKENDNQNK